MARESFVISPQSLVIAQWGGDDAPPRCGISPECFVDSLQSFVGANQCFVDEENNFVSTHQNFDVTHRGMSEAHGRIAEPASKIEAQQQRIMVRAAERHRGVAVGVTLRILLVGVDVPLGGAAQLLRQ